MAQKKGFFYRLAMGRDDQPDFDVSKLPGTRWAVFKDVFFNRFGALVKINLLVVAFCLPALAWLVFSILNGIAGQSFINYTGNLGFGFGSDTSAVQVGHLSNLMSTIIQFAVLIPCFMIASLGFAGAFHTLKLLVWGEGISVGATFFKGIKDNAAHFLWSSLIIGGVVLLVAFNYASAPLQQSNRVVSVLAMTSSTILLVLICFMALFIWTQCVTYKLKFWGLIKNSFLFAIGMIFQNILFVGLTAIPVVIMVFVPLMFQIFFWIFYLICGFSFTFLVWTIYAHYVFDRFINDRAPGAIKDRGVNRMSKEEVERRRLEQAERRRKANNTKFANPKKRKADPKHIETESEVTPLEVTFSRRDLEKLEREKKAMLEAEKQTEQTAVEEKSVFSEAERADTELPAKETGERNDSTETCGEESKD